MTTTSQLPFPGRAGKLVVAHVTHEAVEKMGGIGTVLEGMMTSRVYQSAVRRSILVGPMGGHHYASPMRRLGSEVQVLYSSIDGIDSAQLGARLKPIEWAFGVRFAYGIRTYTTELHGGEGQAEVLLVDVSNPDKSRLNSFKHDLWKFFQIDAAKFEHDWGFEEYCRLAEPAFYALSTLIADDEWPCILFSHEYMGVCTALKAKLEGGSRFRTIFHAHECATARRLVEGHPGHDTAFYNIMRQAESEGLFVEDVFGDQSDSMRHVLISNTWRLDAIIAVGDPTAEELRFLSPRMKTANIHLVYNGIPVFFSDAEHEKRSRKMIVDWAENVAGFRPDYLMTHVGRPVISKGFWRDLKVLSNLEAPLGLARKSALLIILTCGAPPRTLADVDRLRKENQWPWLHKAGYPDLAGPEVRLYDLIHHFNAGHTCVKAMLVNQFGWSRQTLGSDVDENMSFATLRQATDVEFGQSTYEPFGISNFEPLGCGAICVTSSVCGCVSSCLHALKRIGRPPGSFANLIVGDYAALPEPLSIERLLKMTQSQRDQIEENVAKDVADQLIRRLPHNEEQVRTLIDSGRQIARHLGWDSIIGEGMLPLFQELVNTPRAG